MKEVSINDLGVGESLERDLFDSQNRLLLRKGTILIEELINSLKSKGLENIFYIETEEESKEDNEDSRNKNIVEMVAFAEEEEKIKKVYDKMFFEMRRTVLRGTYKKIIQDNLRDDIAILLDNLINQADGKVIKFLLKVKSIYSEYRYEAHSLNTGILSALIGKWLQDKTISLDELCLAGCLHDIGEFSIPRNIYDKKGSLNESDWEQIKKHPLYGAEILYKTPWVNTRVIDAVIKHHERLDGTGYPLKCPGSKIPIMPRIIAVAEAYDSMTTTRPHRKAVSQFEALEELRDRSFGQFDARITRLLYDKMLAYYAGKHVLLSNEDSGMVVITEDQVKRPYIKGKTANYDLTLKGAPKIVMVN